MASPPFASRESGFTALGGIRQCARLADLSQVRDSVDASLRQTPVEDIPAALRSLSEATPAGVRWRNEFGRLQTALLASQSEPRDVVPDLLRLAMVQQSCRTEYLALLEAFLRAQPTDKDHWAQLTSLVKQLRGGDALLRDWVRYDPRAEVRAAATRLFAASCADEQLSFLDQCLCSEKDPATVSAMLAAIHPLRLAPPAATVWSSMLAQYQTPLNADAVRFQAACCRLESERIVAPDVLAELRRQLYSAKDQTASGSVAVISHYAGRLSREAGAALWMGLLEAAEEFDGAAEVACRLLRVACADRRPGWEPVRLASRHRDGHEQAALVTDVLRLAWAGMYRAVTGRNPRLPLGAHQMPAREYPEMRAFPPPVDQDDPVVRQALRAAVASDPLWQGHTDLWRLFGLPAERSVLRALIEA